MQFQNDPKRAAMLRDLLLDYPVRQAENPPPPPPGMAGDEQALEQFYRQWEMNPLAEEFQQEGNYGEAEYGHPDARMGLEGPVDAEQMQYLRQMMPRPEDRMAPVPNQEPSRTRALAELIRGR